MLYAQATYKGSDRLYTFQTTIEELVRFEKVLVRDKNGFSLCKFHQYIDEKPSFKCRNLLLSEAMMKELDEEMNYEENVKEHTVP